MLGGYRNLPPVHCVRRQMRRKRLFSQFGFDQGVCQLKGFDAPLGQGNLELVARRGFLGFKGLYDLSQFVQGGIDLTLGFGQVLFGVTLPFAFGLVYSKAACSSITRQENRPAAQMCRSLDVGLGKD